LDAAESVFHPKVDLSWFAVPFSFCFSRMDDEISQTMRMNPERAFFYLKEKKIFERFVEDVTKKLERVQTPAGLLKEDDLPKEPLTTAAGTAGTVGTAGAAVPIDVFGNLKKYCAEYKFDKDLVGTVIKKMEAFICSYEFAKNPVESEKKNHLELSESEKKNHLESEKKKHLESEKKVFIHRLRYYLCFYFEMEFVNNENYHLLMKDFPEEDKAAKEKEEKEKEEKERKRERKAEQKEKEKEKEKDGGGAKK
jgi:hypothetical protein